LVGGALAGGYMLGEDKRSISQISSDSLITSEINRKIIISKGLKFFNINVDTYEGRVMLNGSVNNQTNKNILIMLARSTSDVKSVTSNIAISK